MICFLFYLFFWPGFNIIILYTKYMTIFLKTFSSFRSKIGKIYVLNATNKEWTVCVRPNIVGKIGKAERDITVRFDFVR